MNHTFRYFIYIFVISIVDKALIANRRINTESGQNEISLRALSKKNNLNKDIARAISSVKVPPQWEPYLNPKTAAFWTEGNHRPDAGFVLFLNEMTVDAAKLWLLRGEIKARYLEEALVLVEQAQRELIRDGLMKDRYHVMDSRGPQESKTNKAKTDLKSVSKDVDIFFIFSPNCSHCSNLASTLVGFPNVIPLQASASSPLKNWDGLKASEYASQETLKSYASDGAVPVLVLHHSKKNLAVILKGERSTEDILLAISQIMNSVKDGKSDKQK